MTGNETQLRKERKKRYRERQKLLKLNEVEMGDDVIRDNLAGSRPTCKRKLIENELSENDTNVIGIIRQGNL